MFLVHLATIPITGTGINPARSLGAAIVYNKEHAWDDMVSSMIRPNHFSSHHLSVNLPCIDFILLLFPSVDFLGWTLHWSCSCCLVPPDSNQSHPIQDQSLRNSSIFCFFFYLLLLSSSSCSSSSSGIWVEIRIEVGVVIMCISCLGCFYYNGQLLNEKFFSRRLILVVIWIICRALN